MYDATQKRDRAPSTGAFNELPKPLSHRPLPTAMQPHLHWQNRDHFLLHFQADYLTLF